MVNHITNQSVVPAIAVTLKAVKGFMVEAGLGAADLAQRDAIWRGRSGRILSAAWEFSADASIVALCEGMAFWRLRLDESDLPGAGAVVVLGKNVAARLAATGSSFSNSANFSFAAGSGQLRR